MSNLKILYPEGPRLTETVTATVAADANFPETNALGGSRPSLYRTGSAVTGFEIEYDLGTGNTLNPDYFAIARADIPVRKDTDDSVTFGLHGDTSGAFPTPEIQSMTIGIADLLGPNNQDYVLSLSAYSQAYQFWRIVIGNVASAEFLSLGTVMWGNAFDLGRDPVLTSGYSMNLRDRENWKLPRTYNLLWQGITETQKIAFVENVLRYSEVEPVFLWDPTGETLFGDVLVNCIIRGSSFVINAHDEWDIRVEFEELV